MNAIPTNYNGINFRSRLEAKWARFFDLLGWPYEYEPIDLNGYIPDFVLKFAKMPIYVEIKPSMTIDDLKRDCQKARLATLGKRLLCLGGSRKLPDGNHTWFGVQAIRLNLCDKDYAGLWVEIFGKGNPNHEEWDISDLSTEMCVIGHMDTSSLGKCKDCQTIFPYCHGYASCPACGLRHGCDPADPESKSDYFRRQTEVEGLVDTIWKQAGNTTQYNRIFYAGKD